MLTILANSFAYDLWRTSGTILIPDSFSLSDHLFENGIMLTVLSQCLICYSTSSLSLLQAVVPYLTQYSPVTHITSILLQTQDLRVDQEKEPCIGFTQENLIENSV